LTPTPNEEGSALVLGGVNDSYYTGDFTYYPVALDAWWVLAADSIGNGSDSFKLDNIIVDSGTSLLVGTPAIVNKLTKDIPTTPDCAKIDTYPTITVTLGGKAWDLSP